MILKYGIKNSKGTLTDNELFDIDLMQRTSKRINIIKFIRKHYGRTHDDDVFTIDLKDKNLGYAYLVYEDNSVYQTLKINDLSPETYDGKFILPKSITVSEISALKQTKGEII